MVRALRPGLTTGLALRACLESYLCDARGSLSWWVRPSTPALAARNVLGITLFGDPTRLVLRGLQSPPPFTEPDRSDS